MHNELEVKVVMVDVGVTKLHVESVEDWAEVTGFVDVEGAAEVDVEVFKVDGDSITVWNPPGVGGLFRMHVELLKSWEIDDNFRLIVSISHSKFDILDIKLWPIVGNISPIDVPGHVVP